MSWCTIESDPGVFSELVSSLGVKDVEVSEIYSLEQDEQAKEHSHGLIFLFKWREETDDRPVMDSADIPELFFARQVVQNACATQAILSVLLNSEEVNLGSELNDFKGFGALLDSETRGEIIGNSDHIRNVHNSFARPEPFISEEVKALRGEKEDVYHFIAYVPFRGGVYEIDGLKAGPILLGEYDADWLSVAKPAIEERMGRYSSSETHFALLSIKQKLSSALEAEISSLTEQLEALSSAMDADEHVADVERLSNQIFSLRSQLEDELANQERQRQENIRRRHNYIPFIMKLLKALAAEGKMQPMVERAREKARTQQTAGRK